MKKATIRKAVYGIAGPALIAALVAGCGTTSGNSGGSSSNGTSTTGTNQSGNTSASTSGKNITIGYVDWSEDVAATYLWKDLLTQKGYNVTLKSLQVGPLFAGLSEGGLDVFFDTWLPTTHKAYMQQYGSNLTNLGKWYQGTTKEGFVVPTYVTNVNTMAQLEANASEFGGQIIGIEPGAGEMTLAANAMKTYGLNNFQLLQSSTPAMLSELARDYQAKKPIVVTLWSPHWAFTKYNLKYIPDPKGAFGGAGWIQTEANKSWASSNPTVANWIKNFKLTPNQLGTLEEDINQNSSNPNAGVQQWIKNNQSVWSAWFQ